MGEIQVLVADGTCVTTDADISIGAYEPPDGGEEGGVDLEIEDRFPVAAGRPELHVVADIGLGALARRRRRGLHRRRLRRLARRRCGRPSDASAMREACGEPRPGYDPASLIGGLLVIALGALLHARPGRGASTLGWDYFLPVAFAVVGGILLAAGLTGPPRKRP